MKKIALAITSLVLTVTVISCQNETKAEQHQIEKASWLIGKWENKSDSGLLTESWKKENDSTYLGHSYFIKGDTLHDEFVKLSEVGGNLVYSPVVKGQNDGKAIEFKMTSATATKLVFENPAHDFPKKIVYNKISDDSIVAEISGMQNGKMASESYPMSKQ